LRVERLGLEVEGGREGRGCGGAFEEEQQQQECRNFLELLA